MKLAMVEYKQIKAIILAILSFCINTLCITYVIYQSIQCITKYVDGPQGTKLSLKNSADLLFPSITICAKFGKDNFDDDYFYNKTLLEDVCGIR